MIDPRGVYRGGPSAKLVAAIHTESGDRQVSTMRDAVIFLSEVRRLLPPDVGNHALLVTPQGKLAVQIRHHRIGQMFYFDESDISRDPVLTAAEVVDLVNHNFAA